MPKAKGSKKTGGRQKGTPNKRTQDLIARAEAMGIDPFDILLFVASGDWKALGYKTGKVKVGQFGSYEVDLISLKDRIWCASEAVQYIYPKRKAIELTGKDGSPLELYLRMSSEERAARLAAIRARKGSDGPDGA